MNSAIANAWEALRRFTPARIALGRSGVSQPTASHLAFQLAHAQARDAVHQALDVPALARDLVAIGLASISLHSAAPNRATYLRRPDLGRALAPESLARSRAEAGKWNPGDRPGASHDEQGSAALDDAANDAPSDAPADVPVEAPSDALRGVPTAAPGVIAVADRATELPDGEPSNEVDEARRFDLAFVVADGLSASAVQRHAVPVLIEVLRWLNASPSRWHIAPVALVEQGRVAIGDEIGACLGAALVVVLIGERPGLSSPDSLGLYITWDPRHGRVDAERNCISNVRPQGLPCDEAGRRLALLLEEARRRRLTGVQLKDESDPPSPALQEAPNFLIG